MYTKIYSVLTYDVYLLKHFKTVTKLFRRQRFEICSGIMMWVCHIILENTFTIASSESSSKLPIVLSSSYYYVLFTC